MLTMHKAKLQTGKYCQKLALKLHFNRACTDAEVAML